jgi:hypothetical protein
MQEGIVTRTRGRSTTTDGATSFVEAHFSAFDHLAKKEPGRWSLGLAGNIYCDPRPGVVDRQAIEMELYGSLPAPPGDVSIQDILEFKERRAAELLDLRQSLDDLYQQIIAAADVPRAKDTAIIRLETAIQSLQRVASESWARTLLRSLKIELKIPELVTVSAAAAAAASTFSISPWIAGTIAAASSLVKFEKTAIRGGKLPEGLKEYAYLFHLPREL